MTPPATPVNRWLIQTLAAGTGRPTGMLTVTVTGDLPYIVVSGVPTRGSQSDATHLVAGYTLGYQIDAVANTADAAAQLTDAVLDTLAAAGWPHHLDGGPSITRWDLVLAGSPMRRTGDPRAIPFIPTTINLEISNA